MSGNTKVVGVFGFPVEHSLSPAMHNAAFAALRLSYIYIPFPVRPEALGPAIRSLPALGIVGVNLTIPHKESVLPFLDDITTEARDVGAVNTVHCVEDKLLGDNTDGRGFYEPLRELGVDLQGKQAVVLGAGGAARAVVFRLAREGAHIVLANRTPERAERLAQAVASAGFGAEAVRPLALDQTQEIADAIAGAELLVHTTRIGMYPETDALPPVPLEAFHPTLLVYDLVYNPVETQLLKQARKHGCRTLTGVKMLVYQGAVAFQRWTGLWPPTEIMEKAVLQGLGPSENA
ncbi:MAG TPA: shikimate dehydrogenase [Chthonomonadaceae bacterium]|nr:shikimate dehydrogenase [Chthonomonadaceae bacterium]